MSEPVLKFDGLCKKFGDVQVLKHVSGTLEHGKVTAFIGPNGAGKTTLFQVLTGEVRPDSGSVCCCGTELVGKSPAQISQCGIGKLFQDVRVFRNLSILDNVVAALCAKEKHNWPFSDLFFSANRRVLRDRAADLLDVVGVNAPQNTPAKELSFGNQKLLAFARLLAGNFQCVLLDEPIAGVAPAMANRLIGLVHRMIERGNMTVAIIEHEFSFVEELANQVIVLSQGQIVGRGETSEVLASMDTRELCLGL